MRNFDLPYFATSPSDFWKRWHMTLGSWLRDYLYFPLGGSKKGDLRTYYNLFVTFILIGLWHGASWTFVVYGCLHALAMSINRYFRVNVGKREKKKLTAESDKAALAPVASSNPLDHHGNVVDWFLSQVSAAGGQDAAKKRHEDALALRAELQRQTLEVKAKMAAAQGVAPEAAPDSGQAVAVQELRDELEYLEAEIEFRSIEADKASRQMKSGLPLHPCEAFEC